MAETFTEHGLQYLYRAAITGSPQLTYYSIGLFVSQTPTTVPASTASGSSSGWTEMEAVTGTYSRQNIAASAIPAPGVVGGSAVGSTWPAVTFTGFTSASPANGIVILSSSIASVASPIAFSNFDSGGSRAFLTTADSLTASPAMRMLP